MIDETIFDKVTESIDDTDTIYSVDFKLDGCEFRVYDNDIHVKYKAFEAPIKVTEKQIIEIVKAFGLVGNQF